VTLEDLKKMDVATIPNAIAADVLKMDPGRLAQYAREGRLGWKVMAPVKSTRVYHNREDFIRFWTSAPAKEQARTETDRLDELIELIRVQNTMLMEITAHIKKTADVAAPTEKE